MVNSYLKIQNKNNNSDTLLVVFTGHPRIPGITGRIPTYDFFKMIETHFHHVDCHYYIDIHFDSYHQGIKGISTNIEETVEYLRNEIRGYKNIIFIGVSAGGYAAIMFGSLLNITSVIAFIPQTFRRKPNINETYRDLAPHINDTTNYYLYGDTSITNVNDSHHISHCERISHHPNVFLEKKDKLNLRGMRDNEELREILCNIIDSP
jgi:predicted esterase YcpF (UPF0227 family)